MAVINTNIMALTAQRNLNKTEGMLGQAMERLSSGLRINSAKDDSAGLAIATRFDSQTRGMTVAMRNAGDGISMAQTAEGALGSMTDNLQRLRELALQSANATNSDSDRASLNAEAQQLIDEIQRVAEQTNFNGTKLLDGSFGKQVFQIGANKGETFEFQIGKMTTDKLGSGSAVGVAATGSSSAIANGDLIINGVAIAASSALDDNASTANAAASAIAKVAAINKVSGQTGVVAEVAANTVSGGDMSGNTAAASASIKLNGVLVNLSVGGNDLAADRKSVVSAINAVSDQTGVKAVDSGEAKTGVTLIADDGRNITLEAADAVDLTKFGLRDDTNVAAADNGTITATAGASTAGAVTFAGIKGKLSLGDQIVINYKPASGTTTTYTATLGDTSGGLLAAVNAALDAAVDSSGNTLGAGKVTATFSGNDLVITGDASNTGPVTGTNTFTDVSGANYYGGFTLRATNGQPIKIESGTNGDSGIRNAGLVEGTYESSVASVSTQDGKTQGASSSALTSAQKADLQLDSGDLVINGVAIGASKAADDTASDATANSSLKEASAIAIAAAINRASEATGVTATADANVVEGTSGSTAGTSGTSTIKLYINNEATATITSVGDLGKDRVAVVDAINSISGRTGVRAEDTGKGIQLVADDGRNISIVAAVDAAGSAAKFGLNGIAETTSYSSFASDAETYYSTVTLQSAKAIKVEAGTNGTTALENLKFKAGTYGGAETGQFLKDVDLSTVDGATKALEAIDNALESINSTRGDLGAVQNRLESTIENIQVTRDNLTASKSRIMDADFASETAQLAKAQVLQQAGIAMLAQAKQAPQQVLSLLR